MDSKTPGHQGVENTLMESTNVLITREEKYISPKKKKKNLTACQKTAVNLHPWKINAARRYLIDKKSEVHLRDTKTSTTKKAKTNENKKQLREKYGKC